MQQFLSERKIPENQLNRFSTTKDKKATSRLAGEAETGLSNNSNPSAATSNPKEPGGASQVLNFSLRRKGVGPPSGTPTLGLAPERLTPKISGFENQWGSRAGETYRRGQRSRS